MINTMRLMNAIRKKPKPAATHSHRDEYASISLASESLQSPLTQLRGGAAGWQKKAWEFYDVVPEMRLVVAYRAAALSKVILRIGLLTPDGVEPIDNEASEAMRSTLFGGVANHPDCLSRLAQHLTVVGETYVFVPKRGRQETWLIVPPDQVNTTQSRVTFTDPITGVEETHDPKSIFNFRLWDPHPHKFWEADSPTRGGISTLDNIMHLTASIKATAVSRLVGRGILPWPLETKMPATSTTQQGMKAEAGLQKQLYDAMAAAIRDPGSAAAAAPIVAYLPAEMIKYLKDKPIDFSTTFDEHVAELRDKEIRRYAAGQPLPSEMVTGIGGVNHWCVDDQTEVLTLDGWRRQDQISVGTVVLTLNHQTGLSQWQPIKDMYKSDVVDEPMVRMESKNHSSWTTGNHRWPVLNAKGERQFTTTERMSQAHRIVSAAPCADVPVEAKFNDDLVELVAWLWTEGSVRGGKNPSVSISQSHTRNPERVSRIRNALSVLFGPASRDLRSLSGPGWRESVQANLSSHGGPVTVFYLNAPASAVLLSQAPDLIVSPGFVRALTVSQLELFIHISEMGDGQHFRQGRHDMWQKNPDMLDAYELALSLSGRMVTRTASQGGWRSNGWASTSVRPLKAARSKSGGTATVEVMPYTGVLWCPVTENSTWFARRDGKTYFTGNTAWHLAEEDLKFDIDPLASTMCAALSLRVVQPLMGPSFVVYPDFSALVSRPNKTPEAIQMFDKGIISRGEAREAAGYPADDMESDEVDQEANAELRDEAPLTVESDRVEPPGELERGTQEAFSDAVTLISRDVLDTAGRWLKTHSGRENRGRLSDVLPAETHKYVKPDLRAVEYAASRAREKYAGTVPCEVLDKCISAVEDLYGGRDDA